EICQDVRAELQRSLEAGEVVPGTPMFDTVHRVLGMVDPAVIYSSRHMRPGQSRFPYYRRPPATQ
ncbi:hypothetical protein A2U01_0084735, partial [Trifolium medium]|nr:hypothetical protein [Trifolium medium]